jgi:hypothetical protein
MPGCILTADIISGPDLSEPWSGDPTLSPVWNTKKWTVKAFLANTPKSAWETEGLGCTCLGENFLFVCFKIERITDYRYLWKSNLKAYINNLWCSVSGVVLRQIA